MQILRFLMPFEFCISHWGGKSHASKIPPRHMYPLRVHPHRYIVYKKSLACLVMPRVLCHLFDADKSNA
jgi:hypothetical protein